MTNNKQTLREQWHEVWKDMPFGESRMSDCISDWWLAGLRTTLDSSIKEIGEYKDSLKYPPIPKGSMVTTDFMYVRGKAVACADILTRLEAQRDLLK